MLINDLFEIKCRIKHFSRKMRRCRYRLVTGLVPFIIVIFMIHKHMDNSVNEPIEPRIVAENQAQSPHESPIPGVAMDSDTKLNSVLQKLTELYEYMKSVNEYSLVLKKLTQLSEEVQARNKPDERSHPGVRDPEGIPWAPHGRRSDPVGCPTCQVYNLTTDISAFPYPCMQTTYVKPEATVCPYPDEQDKTVSKAIHAKLPWEKDLFNELKHWLAMDPQRVFIDLGAHIGTYTLPLATMGHHVIAVEPNLESVYRLHKAAALANLTERITVLANAVSNQRLPTRLHRPKDNQAGTMSKPVYDPIGNYDNMDHAKSIYLNDLVMFCDFNTAIMKIDIMGYEHRAFRWADVLFDRVFIPYVQMEWRLVKAAALQDNESEDYALFMYMIDFFRHRQYVPRVPIKGTRLNLTDWELWPPYVAWTKY